LSHLRHEKERDLATKCEELAWKLAEAIPDKIPDAKLGHTATSFGILVDKMRLLRDESTVITDNRTQVSQLVAVLSAKYGKTPADVAADLIRIRPDMAQHIESRQVSNDVDAEQPERGTPPPE
jgi:hypothetical protein